MSIVYIIFLSIVQGLTEFLPVSSSGHLVVFPKVFGIEDQGILIDLAVHVGTLFAVLVYYFKDVFLMAKSLITWNKTNLDQERKMSIFIILATIPAIVGGGAFHYIFPEGIRDLRVVMFTLVFFAGFMILAERISLKNLDISKINLKTALIIGFAQILAFIPGTSRSGVTITTARFLGLNHEAAAKFSFLLSIPAVAGAGFIGLLEFLKSGNSEIGIEILVAIFASFISGLAAITVMMRFLKKIGLIPFAIYRIILALFLLAFVY